MAGVRKNMKINIVKVSKGEESLLWEIAKLAITESVEIPEEEKEEVIQDTYSHIAQNIEAEDCVFLKYETSEILGFILVKQYWNLSDLFVSPVEHRKGIGASLLKAAIEICKYKASKDFVRVNSSPNAEEFYLKFGFVPFDVKKEIPNFIKPLIYNF